MTAVDAHRTDSLARTPPCILVVDDEPTNFDVIEALLDSYGYALHYVSSGVEAIHYFQTLRPDLVLLDVMMPGLNGIEVCRQIRQLPAGHHVPIMMVTALAEADSLAHCLENGANDFISKPIRAIELRARLRSLLRVKHQYDQLQDLAQVQARTVQVLEQNITELCGSLASSLPHELNTPLNGILGCLELLHDQVYRDLSSEEKELLDLCQQSAYRLHRLTQRCLTYLRLKLNITSDSAMRSCSPTAALTTSSSTVSTLWIRQYLEEQARQAQRLADVMCSLDEAELAISATHLEWLITELTNNAFKFSPVGTRVTLRGQRQGRVYHLCVHNYGRGMTADQISQIDAFRQFERQTFEQQGIGLGLKIVQQIIEQCGGKFEISSTYQKDLFVQISLPIAARYSAH